MIALEKCAAILNRNGRSYSKEELLKIREILYNFARIDEIVRMENVSGKESRNLYSGEYGRAS